MRSFSLSLTNEKQPHKWELRIFSFGARRSLPPRSKLWSNPSACCFDACTRTRGGLSTAGSGDLAMLMGSSKTVRWGSRSRPLASNSGRPWGSDNREGSTCFAREGTFMGRWPTTSPASKSRWPGFNLLTPGPDVRTALSRYEWGKSFSTSSCKETKKSYKPSTRAADLPISVGPTAPIWMSLYCPSKWSTTTRCFELRALPLQSCGGQTLGQPIWSQDKANTERFTARWRLPSSNGTLPCPPGIFPNHFG